LARNIALPFLSATPFQGRRHALSRPWIGHKADKMVRRLTCCLVCMFLLESCQGATSTPPASKSSASVVTKESQPSLSSTAVEVRNGPNPGSLELVVYEFVELDAGLMVERELGNGSFQPLQNLDLGSMKLVSSCDQRLSQCVSVAERTLRPVPWSGMSCSSQCNHSCDKNVRLYGRFRFVVRTCDGQNRFEGPVFEMPKPQ
jgi:hypothetical protein